MVQMPPWIATARLRLGRKGRNKDARFALARKFSSSRVGRPGRCGTRDDARNESV